LGTLASYSSVRSFTPCKYAWCSFNRGSARKTESPPTPTAKDLLLENPYIPTSTLAQAIIRASPLLTELIVVREWLHDTAPPPSPPEANTGYWKFTKHTVMQNIRTGHAPRDGMVSEMDPDAVNRGDGAGLAPDDAVGSCSCPYFRVSLLLFTKELREKFAAGALWIHTRGKAERCSRNLSQSASTLAGGKYPWISAVPMESALCVQFSVSCSH
jgi:hypothetical protein